MRGGYREGSGRKKTLPVGARVRSFKITDTEYQQVKDFIKNLREVNKK